MCTRGHGAKGHRRVKPDGPTSDTGSRHKAIEDVRKVITMGGISILCRVSIKPVLTCWVGLSEVGLSEVGLSEVGLSEVGLG